jgi:hypothetical protein
MNAQVKNEAQHFFLGNDACNPVDDYFINNADSKFHSAFKPYLYSTLHNLDDQKIPYRHVSVHNYFLQNNFKEDKNPKTRVGLQFFPQLNVELGRDLLFNKWTAHTSGGLYARMDINKNFSVNAQIISGYTNFPNFTDTLAQQYEIVPGMGIGYYDNKVIVSGVVVNNRFKTFSFSNFTGSLSYSPKKFINFQLAKDKIFVGDGYRSLLLSDVANNYPYFKTTLNVWKLQYSAWYSWFYDITQANSIRSQFKNKFGTFHYLSWNATKWLTVGAFENIMFQGTDTNRTRGFDANYLNPIIFFRPVEYSLGSSDNAMLGLNYSFKVAKTLKIYGQVALDEFYLKEIRAQKGWWANKQGYQVGLKYINAFGIKKLSLQTEYNYVRPYTYTHGSVQQSYTHFNQALAHPFGANFYEALGMVSYRHNRYRLDFKGVFAKIGRDTSLSTISNMGQNLFLSYITRPYDYGHSTTQGIKTTFMQAEIKYTYYFIPNMNLRFEAAFIQHSLQNEKGFLRQTPFIYIALKTSLYNTYRDF